MINLLRIVRNQRFFIFDFWEGQDEVSLYLWSEALANREGSKMIRLLPDRLECRIIKISEDFKCITL